MHFLAQAPLRANAEAVPDDQHPDHELRIDRGAPGVAIELRQVPAQLAQIEHAVDS